MSRRKCVLIILSVCAVIAGFAAYFYFSVDWSGKLTGGRIVFSGGENIPTLHNLIFGNTVRTDRRCEMRSG